MISEADVSDSVSLLINCVNMGKSLCLSVSPSVTQQGVGVRQVAPGDSFEGLTVIENLYVFSQQKTGEISKNQSGIENTLRVVWSWGYWKNGRVYNVQSILTLDTKYIYVSETFFYPRGQYYFTTLNV